MTWATNLVLYMFIFSESMVLDDSMVWVFEGNIIAPFFTLDVRECEVFSKPEENVQQT